MAADEGRIPQELGLRNTYYREVIPYIHTNILRLTPILGADDTWLVAELLIWTPAYDNAANKSITNKNYVDERDAIDLLIFARLDVILNNLTPWAGLTPTDRNTFGLHERVATNAHITVPSQAPSPTVIGQTHLHAAVKAIDPLLPDAATLPHGAFLVIWIGNMITSPVTVNPAPVLLGWSASIDADLEFPLAWVGNPCNVQCYYVDKHHNKSAVSAAIPVTPI
jgi:hypothetical protein